VKLCIACGRPFEAEGWRCPHCGEEPARVDGALSFAPAISDRLDAKGGFEPEAFEHLARLEEGSFWFRARNELIVWALRLYAPQATSFLEIGCGTGFVLEAIGHARPELRLVGSDLFVEGLPHAQRRLPEAELMQMDARRIPYEAEFDALGAFDVLEHVDDDRGVLAEVRRALRPQGTLIITVPQHSWLWSAADDYAHHVRRYARRELVGKVQDAGFRMRHVTSFISLLLPAMAASRVMKRRADAGYDAVREHERAARLRRPFEAVLDAERALIRRGVSLPAGGSLIAVAERTA
jgi:SAM-dependent methyltransferase